MNKKTYDYRKNKVKIPFLLSLMKANCEFGDRILNF